MGSSTVVISKALNLTDSTVKVTTVFDIDSSSVDFSSINFSKNTFIEINTFFLKIIKSSGSITNFVAKENNIESSLLDIDEMSNYTIKNAILEQNNVKRPVGLIIVHGSSNANFSNFIARTNTYVD